MSEALNTKRNIKSPTGNKLTCKSWATEAPFRMIQNNLDREVAENPDELDEKIEEMISTESPVIFDCHVDQAENCYPMIPSGKPHNQMLLGPKDQEVNKITGKGKSLV